MQFVSGPERRLSDYGMVAPPAIPTSNQVHREDFLMGWNSKITHSIKALSSLVLLSAALLLTGGSAQAQLPGNDCVKTPDDCYNGVCNAYLCLFLGFGKNVAGSIGIISTPNSPSDPGGLGFGNLLLWMLLWSRKIRPASSPLTTDRG